MATEMMQDQEWYVDALCAETDPEEFFPDKGGTSRYAKAICNGDPETDREPCPVKDQCLTWALVNDERFGIYGGYSERERRKMPKPVQELAPTGTDTTVPMPTAVDEEKPTTAPRQYGLPYVGGANGGSHYPLPSPDRVVKIEQGRAAKSSIDWDAIRTQHEERRAKEEPAAPVVSLDARRCRWCTTVAELDKNDLCPTCVTDAETRFTAPVTPVPTPTVLEVVPDIDADDLVDAEEDLAALEEDPKVADASARFTAAVEEVERREEAPANVIPADVTPLDVVAYCEQLLRDTTHDKRPLVQVLRNNALSALAALDLVAHPETPVAVPAHTRAPETPVQGHPDTATGTTPAPARRPAQPKRPRRTGDHKVNTTAIIDAYNAGNTIRQVADHLGHSKNTIRHVLLDARIELRDDRKTNSGGNNRIDAYPDQLVADVRRLYLDEGKTQAEVAAVIGSSVKVVQNVMAKHGITPRPSAAAASQAGTGRAIKLDDEVVDQLVERYEAGESAGALAHAYDVSVPSVLARLRQRDVQIRSRGGYHPQPRPS